MANIVKVDKFLGITKKTNVAKFSAVSKKGTGDNQNLILNIEKKVIKIDKLLKDSLLLQKTQNEKKRVSSEQKTFANEEKELEKKKPKESQLKGGIGLPSPPKIGIFGWIKNFIGNLFLGFIAVRLIDHLPQLIKTLPIIMKAGEAIIDFAGSLLNGLVTFVDWGYKAVDATRGFIKTIGGDNTLKLFDSFGGAVNKLIDVAIIAAMVAGNMGGDRGGGRGGRPGRGGRYGLTETREARRGVSRVSTIGGMNYRNDRTTGYTSKSGSALSNVRIEKLQKAGKLTFDGKSTTDMGFQQRKGYSDVMKKYADKFGKDAAVRRFGQESVEGLGGKYARSGASNVARKAFVGLAGKGGAKAVLGAVKPLLKRLPIIGGLIDFGLSVALGEDPGRAAFKAIGATLLGSVGAAVGSLAFGFGGIVGGILGSIGGDAIGGALYDMFFGGKKPTAKGKTTKAATGGPITSGRKSKVGSGKRTITKKTKRSVKVQQTKIKPGASVGGEEKITKIFPESKDKSKINPLGYMKKSYDTLSSSPGFGGVFGLALKAQLGEKPSDLDYKIAASGLSSWMESNLGAGGAFAEGGSVDVGMFGNGKDMTNMIAKSLEESISSKVDNAINDLMKQLGLKPSEGPAGVPGAGKPGSADMINIQGGDADFWTLVAIASREDGEPQAWADVAQSIYNRLASGAYSGKTIKDLILGQMQYEPTWKYPKPGATGKPNSEWYSIKDAASAGVAAGQSEEAMKKVAAAILDPTLQKNAREFIQGRTDFRGYSVSGGVQRKSGDNYYGWYNNYTANKIGSVPNFGATASTGPGPADGGILGSGKVGAVDQFNPIAKQFGLQITSDYRPGDSGYHGKNRARDYSNDGVGSGTPQQLKFAQYLVKNYGSSMTQLIYTPLGYGIANGKKVGLDYWGASTNSIHYNHVHVAMSKGGIISKPTRIFAGEKGPEFVLDNDTTRNSPPGFLDALNKANTKQGVMYLIQKYASYNQPYGGEPQIVEVPVPMPMPSGRGGGMIPIPMGGGVNNNDQFDRLAIG